MSKTIVFFHPDIKQSAERLELIVNTIPYEDIASQSFQAGGMISATLRNGDRYLAVTANDSARGLRIDQAYISMDITINYMLCVIVPMLNKDADIQYF